MQDLTLVGLTEDKTKLVLVSDAGEEYTLAADAKLRAALRGDHARLGQLEIQMDSALRPKDIQARIRAGESPETVAQAAQTTVDRIMTYAAPVLAERAHIADRAQRASVRRKSGEGQARVLGDVVADQLRGKNVDPDSVEWDSWRREDGRWTVVADYRVGDRPKHAAFVFDVQGRYAVADDDEARWLVGEQVARKAQQRSGGSGRRLSAIGDEQELPLGDDAIEMVTGAAPEARPDAHSDAQPDAHPDTGPDEERTVDLTRTARELRGGGADDLAAGGDADWMATQASERPTPPTDTRRDEGQPATDEPVTSDDAATEQEPAATEEPTEEPAEPQPKKTGRKGRRASVPSWDEIMFGGGRSD
jgi:hypothetical protein